MIKHRECFSRGLCHKHIWTRNNFVSIRIWAWCYYLVLPYKWHFLGSCSTGKFIDCWAALPQRIDCDEDIAKFIYFCKISLKSLGTMYAVVYLAGLKLTFKVTIYFVHVTEFQRIVWCVIFALSFKLIVLNNFFLYRCISWCINLYVTVIFCFILRTYLWS